MKNTTRIFHLISYLQYPLMATAMYYVIQPYLIGIDQLRENFDLLFASYEKVLVFMGLALSFSTLQDTTKTQNKLSQKVWESPKWGKVFLLALSLSVLLCMCMGVIGMYASATSALSELSFGLLVLGIGILGILKTAIEMFENHRKDRQI